MPYYNRQTQGFLGKEKYVEAYEDFISPGIGEMNYGKSFATLFKENKEKSGFLQIFNNSVNSLRALGGKAKLKIEEESRKFDYEAEIWSQSLTFFVILFGSLGALGTVFDPPPIENVVFSLSLIFSILFSWFYWLTDFNLS